MMMSVRGAKNVAHHLDELKHSIIVDKVENTVRFFFRAQDTFFSQYRQMLRNIALAGSHFIDNILYANRIITQDAQNF